jgi:alkanesulfonate monooxygenase SsuD/methylene tetrahydromethanopterin reductase-like flavin-dependent oxidoreductase (luciferase family)
MTLQSAGGRSDHELYAEEMRLVDLAADSGFESIWTLEHHFSDYVVEPDPLQLLTWIAARHPQVRIGTSVIVIPWHDPVRCAERIAMLDILTEGRLIIGFGRGINEYEFEGMRVDMETSRGRFVAYTQMVVEALRTGFIEGDNEYIRQPRRELRPRPFYAVDGRVFGAAMSPESMPLMAKLGVSIFVIPQKPWDAVVEDFATYGKVWRDVHGTEAPAPMATGQVVIAPNADRAEELAARYIGGYYHSVMEHYGFTRNAHQSVKSFEFYEKIAKYIDRHGTDGATADYISLHPYGTPDMVLEKLDHLRRVVGISSFAGSFSFAGMPYDEARAALELFAREVLPVVKEWEAEGIPEPQPRVAQHAGA